MTISVRTSVAASSTAAFTTSGVRTSSFTTAAPWPPTPTSSTIGSPITFTAKPKLPSATLSAVSGSPPLSCTVPAGVLASCVTVSMVPVTVPLNPAGTCTCSASIAASTVVLSKPLSTYDPSGCCVSVPGAPAASCNTTPAGTGAPPASVSVIVTLVTDSEPSPSAPPSPENVNPASTSEKSSARSMSCAADESSTAPTRPPGPAPVWPTSACWSSTASTTTVAVLLPVDVSVGSTRSSAVAVNARPLRSTSVSSGGVTGRSIDTPVWPAATVIVSTPLTKLALSTAACASIAATSISQPAVKPPMLISVSTSVAGSFTDAVSTSVVSTSSFTTAAPWPPTPSNSTVGISITSASGVGKVSIGSTPGTLNDRPVGPSSATTPMPSPMGITLNGVSWKPSRASATAGGCGPAAGSRSATPPAAGSSRPMSPAVMDAMISLISSSTSSPVVNRGGLSPAAAGK